MTRARFRRETLAGPVALLVAGLALLALLAACSSSSRRVAEVAPNAPAATPGEGPTPTPTPAPPTATATPDAADTADPGAAGADATDAPTAQATPVFVDEPCDPATPGPEMAINGLDLYCAANANGSAAWATQPPPSPTPSPKNLGGQCDVSQSGSLARSSGGRPVECIRDPDGSYRWVDVS